MSIPANVIRIIPPSDEVTTGDIFLTYVQLFGEEAIDSESLDQRLAEVMSQFVADEMVEVEEDGIKIT